MNTTAKAVGLGLAAGAFGGLFGVGGGIVLVPGLVLLLGFDQYRASGTSMATIVASSGAALVTFAAGGSVDWRAATLLFVGAGAGAWLAARRIERIPQHVLTTVFAVFVAIAAVRLWL